MTRFPACARWSQACRSRVLFPIPGSPPIRISPPSTIPPPSTRSSSVMPVLLRSAVSSGMSFRGSACAPVPGRWFAAIFPPAFSGAETMLSSSVFQAPQPGQRPTHRGVSYPHALHVNIVLAFGMQFPSFRKQGGALRLRPGKAPVTNRITCGRSARFPTRIRWPPGVRCPPCCCRAFCCW